MIKQFSGYEDAKKAAHFLPNERLPIGAYVCKILEVKVEEGKAAADGKKLSDRLIIQFDIAEGEYQDFFRRQYENMTNENKKFKGRTTIYIPRDDGSKEDSWTKNDFARWTYSLEESNSGYVWDWDESKWKNKLIGIVFGETGTIIDKKEIVFTEARFPVSVETVRSGKAPEAKFKAKNGYGDQAKESETSDFMNIPDDMEEELPF